MLMRRGPSVSPHPVVFLVLITPFGVMSGYLTVALAYLLAKALARNVHR